MAARRSLSPPLYSTKGAARPAAMTFPGFTEPCHPADRDRPPSGNAWVHEIKADGYRAQVHLRAGKAIVYSRRGHDWTREFFSIARAAEALPARHAVLDGEAIVQNKAGIADFHALRRQLAKKQGGQLTFYAFDLLYLDGEDLRGKPLMT